MKRTLAQICQEPFRIFFPAGAALGIVGVSLWMLYYLGAGVPYPSVAHARLMIQGLMASFIFGFLGTAGPRLTSAPHFSPTEIGTVFSLDLLAAGAHTGGAHRLGDICFVICLLLFARMLLRRFRQRKDNPPPNFILVALGILSGIIGAALVAYSEDAQYSRSYQAGSALLNQCFVLLPILGVAPFFIGRLLDLPGSDLPETRAFSRTWKRQAAFNAVIAIAIIASFLIENAGPSRAAAWIRVAAIAIYLAARMPWRGRTFLADFQKRVIKDAELFLLQEEGGEYDGTGEERGFADVWKKDCFAWEYKGKKKNLDDAYRQLLRYRESLQNPPLLVVCDFDRYKIKTNFNGTVQETHEFTNSQIDEPKNIRLLRALFREPEFLKPQRTTAQVTEKLAAQIAGVARSLQKRESRELSDGKTRAEMNVAQRKNLRIARFLNRVVFCFFAEDTDLLPKGLFTEVARTGLEDSRHFAETLERLFAVMATGGKFGTHKIRHFNGHLFEESSVFELTEDELRDLADAAEADWQFIEPSIMGTLFERALEPKQRSQLGAHYTSEVDIKTLVEPVLMAPLRREWARMKAELAAAYLKGKGTPAQRDKLGAFQKKLTTLSVLDPACGSGNFLYVSLQLLLDLEKEVVTYATQLGFKFTPQVSVQQLRAIEINPYAFELAQVSVQIGFLQWRRDNGFDNDRSPVLQNLEGFQNEDALLVPHFRSKAKTLKEAQAGEHRSDDALKFYSERDWPTCDIIVSNPPFLGDKLMRGELGDAYVDELRRIYSNRIPGQSDLCCYWFEKARDSIEHDNCARAGLLATQGIRGGANRVVLKRIKETGDIFFAVSDREWILDGATVHVSLIGFDNGADPRRILDGQTLKSIPANLSKSADITATKRLLENERIGFIGVSMHGPFDTVEDIGLAILREGGNPNLRPTSDVLRPVLNALEITKREERRWLISFPPEMDLETVAGYAAPMKFIREHVLPVRQKNHRKAYRDRWWLPGEARPAMQHSLRALNRFVATPRVSKHRIFVWIGMEFLPSDATVAFARADDYFFGVVHSRFHEIWALALGTQLREKESGFRYTPTTCFETFPFPRPTPALETAIATAATELNELRERWRNPPEWTEPRALEFPGSANGPWSRYVDSQTVDRKSGIGTVRYPRLEPRDADCAAKLKKRTLTNLYNERPAWLDLAHKKLDAAVAAAYGWNDLVEIWEEADQGAFYDFATKSYAQLETDEKGLCEAWKNLNRGMDEEILKRLLALNLERAAAETQAAQLPSTKKRTSRAKSDEELI